LAIEHDSIQLSLVDEPHHDPFLHTFDHNSSNSETDSENAYINGQQPPVQTHVHGTAHLDNRLAGKPIGNQYFDIFDN